jgi:hypothetical protein
MTHMAAVIVVPSRGSRDVYQRTKATLRRIYDRLLGKRWFKALLVGYLALIALGGIGYAIIIGVAAASESTLLTLSFWEWGQVVSATASGALVVVGFVRWRRSRLAAYRWFERALLVYIFVTEFFAFYQNQTTQVFGLIVVLLTYAAIRGMIGEEEARERATATNLENLPA